MINRASASSLHEGSANLVATRTINPTLVVFFGTYFTYGLLLILAFTQLQFSVLLHIPIFIAQTLLVILMFTPLHDAVHKSASKNPRVNTFVLHSLWPMFLNAPFIFKLIHLAHHAHTNKGEIDPDHYTSATTWTGRWIKSFFLIFSYYGYALRFFPRTSKNVIWMILSVMGFWASGVVLWFTPWAVPLFMAWFLPGFIGIGFLGFLNTAWPHYPGSEVSKIKNTKILLVPKPLEWLLLSQNYHLLHHLRPSMPWYDYKAYWAKHRERLLAEGADVVDYRKKN